MSFNLLAQLLHEDEEITSGLKKAIDSATAGYKAAKDKHKEAENKKKEAESEAKKKQAEAEKAAKKAVDAEARIAKKAEAEAKNAAKAAAAEHKMRSAEELQVLRRDLDEFISTFFDEFPGTDGATIEDIVKRFQTKEAAAEGYKTYQQLADRLEKFLTGINNSATRAGKVSQQRIKAYVQQAYNLAKKGVSAIPDAKREGLINFVKGESKFFKRLIRVDANFKLNDADFVGLIETKLKQTDPARWGDAIQALNLVFRVLIDHFEKHANKFRDAAQTFDDEETTAAKATRDAAAAKTAAEREAAAKR